MFGVAMLLTAPAWDAFEPLKTLLLDLAQERRLDVLLTMVVGRLIDREDVALARIWLLAPGDACAGCANRWACNDRSQCLHLVASAARPLHGEPIIHRNLSDSRFRRVPVGAFKVGHVAKSAETVVLPNPAEDPKIRHPQWVTSERILTFVGQPLVSHGRLVGVLGVFLRIQVTAAGLDILRILGNHVAAAICTAEAFEQVETMRRSLQLENTILREAAHADDQALVAESSAMREILRDISAVAATDSTALILGESGTGKELIARSIHRQSTRRERAFVAVNCAAIPKDLYESEFFGHVRGAFSGAVRDRVGRFEAANGGTLFLDEIGETPLDLQGKLLRVLQERSYERVGEGRTQSSDVRIIAATNRDLVREVELGRFREDLYYRLNIFSIEVPPLRDRKSDIPALAEYLLRDISRRVRRPPIALTTSHVELLQSYAWPGNVRELRNVLERAQVASEPNQLRLVLPRTRAPRANNRSEVTPEPQPSTDAAVLRESELRQRDRENLLAALEQSGGKIYGPAGAAAALGIKPTTLASRLKKLNLVPARQTRWSEK
jgi:transcriptional regulator with GAF, ATPase, and Fis domain